MPTVNWSAKDWISGSIIAQERGLELSPTEHVGVHATQMQRQGTGIERARLDGEATQKNADLIREKPEQVLTIISQEKSVFDRRDVARALHRYINDDAQTFQNALASVMASPALAELQPERVDPQTGEIELAKYSTRQWSILNPAWRDLPSGWRTIAVMVSIVGMLLERSVGRMRPFRERWGGRSHSTAPSCQNGRVGTITGESVHGEG